MKTRKIAIVTGWGNHLGTGHIQRMANLADHVNRQQSLQTYIVCDPEPRFLPDSFSKYFSSSISSGTALVIRDKRDSEIREMNELKNHGRLVAIDDCGPGRDLADLSIDLLPNLKYTKHEPGLFLYGYTFTDSIRKLGVNPVPKEIDYALYCGMSPSRETVEFLLSLIPENSSCALLAGSASRIIDHGKVIPLHASYAETLLSAKVLISHFGITLYEGHAAGCGLIAINPSDYHSRLSHNASPDLGLINLGVIDTIDRGQARAAISGALLEHCRKSIDPSLAIEKIETGLTMFMARINAYL